MSFCGSNHFQFLGLSHGVRACVCARVHTRSLLHLYLHISFLYLTNVKDNNKYERYSELIFLALQPYLVLLENCKQGIFERYPKSLVIIYVFMWKLL